MCLVQSVNHLLTVLEEQLTDDAKENKSIQEAVLKVSGAIQFHNKSWDDIMALVSLCYELGNDTHGNLIGDITHALVDVNKVEVINAIEAFITHYNENNV